ncbi:MAG: hypothetical protein FWD14_00230 [Treponema sp.]|nr:hypothetical protein [Treponema sp.]
MSTSKIVFAAKIMAFSMFFAACASTQPFTYTDSFNVSSEHFRETRRGPWETMGNTQFRLSVNHEEKEINVRGRGSNDDDAKDNLDFRIREPAEEWFPGLKGRVKVHSGFLRRYESVRKLLLDTAFEYPDYAIRVSGFSLGGTWTQLFLLDVIQHWPDRDVLAIFYAPANPWRRLPKSYQRELKQRTVFVRTHWDPITWMHLIGFFRYGHTITVGKWYRVLPAQHEPPQMIRALEERFPPPPSISGE